MNKIVIDSLPNVDETPDQSQSRIAWIKNGEPLNAASTRYGNQGELNRPGVQIQENVVFVHGELTRTATQVNKNSSDINSIKETLEITTDLDAVTQVYKTKDDVELLAKAVNTHGTDISALKETSAKHTAELGIYNPDLDETRRTIRSDIVFIKDELGSYPGQNKNGAPDLNSKGSGMKLRIISNSDAVSKISTRVESLENKFSDSSVGALSTRIDQIRSELGTKTLETPTLYEVIDKNNLELGTLKSSQDKIKDLIDFDNQDSISKRLSNVEILGQSLDGIVNTSESGLTSKVSKLEQYIGVEEDPASILGKLKTARSTTSDIKSIIGPDTSSGIRGQIAWIHKKIGIVDAGQAPDPSSIEGKLSNILNTQIEQQSAIQTVEAELGNSSSGIIGRISEVSSLVYGNPEAEDQVKKAGLLKSVDKLSSDSIKDVDDLNLYLRTKDQWIKKSMAIGCFAGENIKVDLSKDGFEHSFGTNLVASDFNNQVRVINNEIVIDDPSIYDINISAIVEKAYADKILDLTVYMNDTPLKVASVGVKTVSGFQALSTSWFGRIEENSRLRVAIKAEESQQEVVLKSVNITLVPAQ